MAVIKGLKNISAYNEEQERRKAAANAPKTVWFKLEKDRESAKVRFLQELDADSPNYSAKNDLGFIAVEHNGLGPEGYKRKALCTADEGACFPCEEHRRLNAANDPEYKGGYKAKSRLYVNVLVEKAGEEPYVAVLSQGMSGKQITPTLIEYAGENGSVTDKIWKITRTGTGVSDTSYTIFPTGDAPADQDVESFDLFDLDNVVRNVDYSDQPAHFGGVAKASSTTQSEATSSASSDDVW